VEGLIFVRDGARGRPAQVHGHRERRVRHIVVDIDGGVQAGRQELVIDLEINVGSRADSEQKLRACAPILLADKDVGPGLFSAGVLKGVDMHLVMHTATGTHLAVEVSKGGPTMELELGGASRGGMRPWSTGGESDCYEGQQQHEQTASDACDFHEKAPYVLRNDSRRTSLAKNNQLSCFSDSGAQKL